MRKEDFQPFLQNLMEKHFRKKVPKNCAKDWFPVWGKTGKVLGKC